MTLRNFRASLDVAIRAGSVVGDFLQPRSFPEDQAPGLAAAMRQTSASESFEMNRVLHAPGFVVVDRIASLVGSLEDSKASPAKGEHLWHERQSIELPALVQCCENFILASNLDPVTGTKPQVARASGEQIPKVSIL